MDCKDFESYIFTYAELSAEEKRNLDEHLSDCLHCRELFQQATHVQTIISLAGEQKPLSANAASLTSKIMAKIYKPAKKDWKESVMDFLQSRASKYSLSTISCLLVLILLLEVIPNENRSSTSSVDERNGTVILNSRVFRESMMKKKNKASSTNDCRSPFRSSYAVIDCMKSKMKPF